MITWILLILDHYGTIMIYWLTLSSNRLFFLEIMNTIGWLLDPFINDWDMLTWGTRVIFSGNHWFRPIGADNRIFIRWLRGGAWSMTQGGCVMFWSTGRWKRKCVQKSEMSRKGSLNTFNPAKGRSTLQRPLRFRKSPSLCRLVPDSHCCEGAWADEDACV